MTCLSEVHVIELSRKLQRGLSSLLFKLASYLKALGYREYCAVVRYTKHEFGFKKRSQDILTSWGKQLDEPTATPGAAATPTTNGNKEDKPATAAATPAETPAPEDAKKEEKPAKSPTPAPEAAKTNEPVASVEPAVA